MWTQHRINTEKWYLLKQEKNVDVEVILVAIYINLINLVNVFFVFTGLIYRAFTNLQIDSLSLL